MRRTIINTTNVTNWHRTAEFVSCVASAMNGVDANATNTTDLKLSRAFLAREFRAVVPVERMDWKLTIEDVDVISSALEFVTLVPTQLSQEAAGIVIQLLLDATKGDGDAQRISNLAAERISCVSSNVLEADQLGRSPTDNVTDGRLTTVESVTSVLAAVSRSVAASLVSNQDAVTLETVFFEMQVARININSWSTVGAGVKAVAKLSDMLPSDLELQTITWKRNPFATLVTDVPFENAAMLVSSRVVTVNLYSAGHILNVSNLDDTRCSSCCFGNRRHRKQSDSQK